MRTGTSVAALLAATLAAAGGAGAEWLPLNHGVDGAPARLAVEGEDPHAGVQVALHCAGVWLSAARGDGEAFHTLSLPGGGVAGNVGQPAMPFRGSFVEVPEGVDVRVEIIERRERSMGTGYRIRPAQPPRLQSVSHVCPGLAFDAAAYGADRFYPAAPVAVGEAAVIRGRRVVFVKAFPYQYSAWSMYESVGTILISPTPVPLPTVR